MDSVIQRFETGGTQEDAQTMWKSNYWWEDDVCLENLGLQELEECMAAMQVLKKNLLKKADDDLGMANSYDHVLIPNLTFDAFFVLSLKGKKRRKDYIRMAERERERKRA